MTRIAISIANPVLSPVEARHWRTHSPFDKLRAVRLLLPRDRKGQRCADVVAGDA
jgi:hypothetical protein